MRTSDIGAVSHGLEMTSLVNWNFRGKADKRITVLIKDVSLKRPPKTGELILVWYGPVTEIVGDDIETRYSGPFLLHWDVDRGWVDPAGYKKRCDFTKWISASELSWR
jgi:hypothetical protein